MAEVQTIEIGASVKLSGAVTWYRRADGSECCEPCAVLIAMRVYEREADPSNAVEDNMRAAALRVLDRYFWKEMDTTKENDMNAPPMGIVPKWRHDEMRADEILDAMARYAEAAKAVPGEWVAELKICFLAKRTVGQVRRKPRFMLVNGRGLCLTVSGVWSFRINPLDVRVFETWADATQAAAASPYGVVTVVELDFEPSAAEK